MHIYLKNILATFHPDPISNDRVLGYFKDSHPQQQDEFLFKKVVADSNTEKVRFKHAYTPCQCQS